MTLEFVPLTKNYKSLAEVVSELGKCVVCGNPAQLTTYYKHNPTKCNLAKTYSHSMEKIDLRLKVSLHDNTVLVNLPTYELSKQFLLRCHENHRWIKPGNA